MNHPPYDADTYCHRLLLRFIYQPFPVQTYLSVQHLQQNIIGGQLNRNVHH